ncbi:MAG TPA: recombination mediator RecR [Patescibacteria group bacterium]|nr:recombination mediator RecR [Patescibacteria group bacterium]
MPKIAKPLSDLIESFEKLPGVGPKTAERLTFYMLRVPQSEIQFFADSLTNLKKLTKVCDICKNVSETNPCPICADDKRDQSKILVVEEPFDILVFERGGKYDGLYHVLHGAINPLENIGPDELYIDALLKRTKATNGHTVKEVIIATNPTMEGDATAMYIGGKLKDINDKILVTRLGMGIPTGADLGFADDLTLTQALAGRREL